MYWFLLIVASIPFYLIIGWVIFDSQHAAAESFFDSVILMAKHLVLGPFRHLLGIDETDQAASLMTVGCFLLSCAAITYGEHYLIQRFYFGETTVQQAPQQ